MPIIDNVALMAWETDLSATLKNLPPPVTGHHEGSAKSAVLVPIAFNPEKQRLEIILTKRSMLVESHKGQISFPGGYLEPHDETELQAAIREAHEEIGLHPDAVQILGALSPVVTRFSVTIFPWVGRLELPYPFQLSHGEVEKMVFLSVDDLLNRGLTEVQIDLDSISVKSIGIWAEGELVWGATAKILEQLREVLLTSVGAQKKG